MLLILCSHSFVCSFIHAMLTSAVHVVLKHPVLEPDEADTLAADDEDDADDADDEDFDAVLPFVLLILLGFGLLEADAAGPGCFLLATFLASTFLGRLTFRRECDSFSAKASAALFLGRALALGMTGDLAVWERKNVAKLVEKVRLILHHSIDR